MLFRSNLSKMEIADALATMLTLSLKHHVTIDSRFVNLFMSVIILEGVGRQLENNPNIIAAALPIIRYSIPEYEEAAITAIKDSKFARKSLYVSVRSFLDTMKQSVRYHFKKNESNLPEDDLNNRKEENERDKMAKNISNECERSL